MAVPGAPSQLRPPRQRPARLSPDAAGRTPVYALRQVSGLPLPVRVERQVERDALVARLDRLDELLEEVTDERRAIVDALAALREELYPVVPWAKGRRPPDIDRSPLPPATEGAQPLAGRALRAACLTILRRHGATSLRELQGLLHRYGYVVAARRPVTALSDAMAYEVERRRARRVERGVYEATAAAPQRLRTPPPLRTAPAGPWRHAGTTPLDPDLDEDPIWWATAAWPP